MREFIPSLKVVLVLTVGLMVSAMTGCSDDKSNNNDNTSPTVSSVTPADASTLVSISTNVTATFSEDMDTSTITGVNFIVMQGAAAAVGTVTYSSATHTATFDPSVNLLPNTAYSVTITTGVEDLAGNAMTYAYVWSFTTGPAPDVTPPTVASTVPANSAVNVSVNGVVTATFSEPLNSTTVTLASFLLIRSAIPVTGSISYTGNTATFTPTAPLAENAVYTATITTAVADLSGNVLAAEYNWSFTTESTTDVTPPTVLSTVPASLATNVSVSGNITASFSETMNAATITGSTFTLRQGVTPVTGSVSYAGTTATFNPSADLGFNLVYTATITTGATDLSGNALTSQVVWTFTTTAAPDVTPPTVVTVVPASGAIDFDGTANLTATFSEPMNPASISNLNFMLMQGIVHVNGTMTYSGNTMTFNPSSDLAGGATCTATIFTGVEDLAGNNLAASFTWSFTTAIPPDVTPPTVVSTVPANTALGVLVGANVTATFSEPMNAATLTTSTFTLAHGGTPVTGVVSYAGGTVSFDPTGDLDSSTVFTATITTGAQDLAGNAMAANFVWTFTTGDPGDVSAPTVISQSPANLDVNVVTVTSVTATFNEPMDPTTISTSTFTLTDGVNPVPGVVSYSGVTATFNPSIMLDTLKLYGARITTGATDLAGNPLAADFAWVFTTEHSPAVIATVPADAALNLPITAKVSAQFSKAMDASSFNASTFTLSDGSSGVAGTISGSGPNVTFDPSSDLLPNTVYTATLTGGVTDVSGNHMIGNKVWTFTTGSNSDVTAPTITATDPADLATSVDRDKQIRAFFSEPMDVSTLTTTTFTVSLAGVPHPGTVEFDGTIVTFKPTAGAFYSPNSVYTARITTTATDISGNALATEKLWTFTTKP